MFSFHEGTITEIEASFNHVFWDDMLPIWDQKYGAGNVDRAEMPITDLETKKITTRRATGGQGYDAHDQSWHCCACSVGRSCRPSRLRAI
jgi:hypothetical protein